MEEKIVEALKIIGYNGAILSKDQLEDALPSGTKNVEFTKLVNYLTTQLRTLLNIDEEVNAITNSEDSAAFNLEISSFLKELNCPYAELTQGHVSDRIQSIPAKLLLVDYLITELMAARILHTQKPNKTVELKINESSEAADLKQILIALRFPKPPSNITVPQLFQKLVPTLEVGIKKADLHLLGKSALKSPLSGEQWAKIEEIQKDLHEQYEIRRKMLLTRLDVTIQSFKWSDKFKGKTGEIDAIYAEKRSILRIKPDVEIADLLAARNDIAIIDKTSSSDVRKNTKSSLNKVIIGQVPDRGGRTADQQAPAPEMPSWQQRTAGPPGGRGRGNFSSRGGRAKHSEGNYNNRQANDSGAAGNYSGSKNSNASYTSNNSSYDNRAFDSAGYYGGHDQSGHYEQSSKRPKTYDSFQSGNRASHAEQYVEEGERNRGYRGGGRGGRGRGGGGRSNYRRGGRNDYY